jgi:hypothetical protein
VGHHSPALLHSIDFISRINRTIHVLLIGIDKYKHPVCQQLAGAVKDAQKMEHYFTTTFPSTSRIRALYNENATRDAIVNEIIGMIQCEEITRQDPIVIFYAGHGGETKPPSNWNVQDSNIQMIIPHDYDDGIKVITDRALATLLDELAWQKGDNIVSF